MIRKSVLIAFYLCFVLAFAYSARPKAFTVIILTDTQMGFISKNENCDAEIVLYNQAVDFINRIKPAFVVITGDFVNRRTDTTQIRHFKAITARIHRKIPVYLIPGNHDMGQLPTPESIDFYFKQYKNDRFEFTYRNVQFIGLNSCYINSGLEQEAKQYNWLKAKLSVHPKQTRKIVFTHHPFFIKSIDEPNSYSNIAQPGRADYMQLFLEKGVVAVFSGHYHNNAESSFEGVQMITSSAIGKQLGQAKSGLRILQVYPDSISHRYVALSDLKNETHY